MKTNRQLNKEEAVFVVNATQFGGYGITKINGWPGSALWEFDNNGWEHVAVFPDNMTRFSTQKDLDEIKEIFWEKDDVVVQFLPRKPRSKRMEDNTIHLWRPKDPEVQKMFG